MATIQRVLTCVFCLSLFCAAFCVAQEESLGDVARRTRAARAAKDGATSQSGTVQNATVAQNNSAPAAPPEPIDPSKEAFVIERSTTKIAIEADGTAMRDLTVAIRMMSDAGVKQFAVLRFPFSSANELVEISSVQVRKPNGVVITTPESDVQDMPQEVTLTAPTYSDLREKHIAVRGLGVGDLLEARVRFRLVKPQVPGQFWFQYSFTKNSIIKDERLEITCPSDKYLSVRSPEHKPEIHDEGSRRVFRWSSSHLERQGADAIRPKPGRAELPSVQVSTFRSWDDVGRWFTGLLQEQVKITTAVQAKAADLTKGLSSNEEKIRAIYDYVSLRVHYVSVSFGIGRYQPHASEDVLANAYGDCKDKHTLLAALLKAAGYDSWPVLINASREIDPAIPSPGQFDHVITAIPIANQLFFADSTVEVAPLGLLLPILRDKQALGLPTAGLPQLLRTPAEPPFASSQSFAVTGKLDTNGVFTARMEQTLRGDEEVALRITLRRLPQSRWTQLIQALSFSAGFGGEVADVSASETEDLAHALRVSYRYTKAKFGDWDNRQITLPLPAFGIEGNSNDKAARQTELGSPQEVVYRSKIELPPGYTVTLPRPVHLVKPYLEYHATHTLNGDVLSSTRRMVIKQRDVPPNDWEGFRRFCKEVTADETTFIKLRTPVAMDDEGRTSLPSQAKVSVSAEDARQALTYLRAGNAKYNEGDFRGALAEYQNAIALDPGAAIYYHAAGLAEAHLGHHPEAIALYQQAIALNPKFMEPREDIGYEYWVTKQFQKAVDVYREMLSIDPTWKAAVIRKNLVCALDDSGDHEQARKVEAGTMN